MVVLWVGVWGVWVVWGVCSGWMVVVNFWGLFSIYFSDFIVLISVINIVSIMFV